MASQIRISSQAQAHIAAYLEYRAIVGDADGGVLMSEEEFARYKAKAIEARKHRIYVNYRCKSTGVDCKVIGPQSRCFCNHKYQEHATDNYQDKNIHCRAKGCPCKLFDSIPSHGAWIAKCACKHGPSEHDVLGARKCRRPKCLCSGFYSTWSCSCGQPWSDHETVFETREEREAAGRPVDNLAGGGAGYAAMGGLLNFSSLVDGVDRLEGPQPLLLADERAGTEAAAAAAVQGREPAAILSYEEGVYFRADGGKMTQEDEFAIYEQKYKKQTRVPVSRLPSSRAQAVAAAAAGTVAGPAASAAAPSEPTGAADAPTAPGLTSAAAAAAAAAARRIRAPARPSSGRLLDRGDDDVEGRVTAAPTPFDLMHRPHVHGEAPQRDAPWHDVAATAAAAVSVPPAKSAPAPVSRSTVASLPTAARTGAGSRTPSAPGSPAAAAAATTVPAAVPAAAPASVPVAARIAAAAAARIAPPPPPPKQLTEAELYALKRKQALERANQIREQRRAAAAAQATASLDDESPQ